MSVFNRLKFTLRRRQLLTIYYGLFNSVANYGIIAWGSAYMDRLKKIINLQSRVLKIILGTDSREESCIILNLKQSYYFEVIVKKYDELKKMYSNKNSVTRNKSLTLTRYKLVTG